MTCIHHYGKQGMFASVRILLVVPVRLPDPSDLFTISIVLPFPGHHQVGQCSVQPFGLTSPTQSSCRFVASLLISS